MVRKVMTGMNIHPKKMRQISILLLNLVYFGVYFGVYFWGTGPAFSVSPSLPKKHTLKGPVNSLNSKISPDVLQIFDQTLEKYNQSKLVEMDIVKEVSSDLLGSKNKYEGVLHLSEGKFRWEIQSPEHSLILFDGKTLWNVQYPSQDFNDGKTQITKSKLGSKNKEKFFWLSILGPKVSSSKTGPTPSVEEKMKSRNLKIVKVTEEKDSPILHFELDLDQKDLQIKLFVFSVHKLGLEIHQVSYIDDVGNKTILNFKNIQFQKKENLKIFKYEPEKGAQVTNI